MSDKPNPIDFKKLIFRNATPQDLDDIMLIEYHSFSPLIQESKLTFLERINQFPQGFRILQYKSAIIGYISSEIWSFKKEICEETFSLDHSIAQHHTIMGDELYISSMGILPAYRHLGLGKYLFESFLKYCAGQFPQLISCILIVSEDWKNARKIYQNSGFSEIGLLLNFFKSKKETNLNKNAVIMQKKIP